MRGLNVNYVAGSSDNFSIKANIQDAGLDPLGDQPGSLARLIRQARDRRNNRDRRRRQPLPVKTETQLTAQFELAGYISKGEV